MEALESVESEVIVDGMSYEIPVVENITDSLNYSENLTVLQAQVLLEDAYCFRSVHHKLDSTSLRLYRLYHSLPIQILLGVVITIIHLLVLFERPSSLSWNADLRFRDQRVEVPCWAVQTIEIICLLLLVLDCSCKTYFIGQKRAFHNPWLICYAFTLVLSILDWSVSMSYLCTVFRLRRFVRPMFMLQHSSIMKKTIKCLRSSLSEVISVILFLAILIYLSTLVAMCIFPNIEKRNETAIAPITNHRLAGDFLEDLPPNVTSGPDPNSTISSTAAPTSPSPENKEGEHYFDNFWDSLFSLVVLTTTANNPDIMMPIYNTNRLYALFFIAFVVIGLYCLTNMLTAVVFNQFRGYFLSSIQTQLFRRRVAFRGAYSVLLRGRDELTTSFGSHEPDEQVHVNESGLPVHIIRRVIPGARIPTWQKELIMNELRSRSGCVLDYPQFSEVMSIMDETTRPQVELQLPWRPGRVSRVLQKIFVSKWFDRFGMLVCLTNIVVITVEVTLRYDIIFKSNDVELEYINAVFIAFYLCEQVCKLWAYGFARYLSDRWNIFDLFLTLVLAMMELVQVIFTYSRPTSSRVPSFFSNTKASPGSVGLSFWDGTRIVNLLIVIRFLRIVPRINSIRLVGSTIRDLAQNLKSFAGVLLTAYYVFGLLGMELFGNKITYESLKNGTDSFKCGSYAQLHYWSNNFDDFAAATVTLWDLMVVNNWHVIVRAYVQAVGPWSHVYFVVWWLISVLIILNLVVALIIENFIQRWDKNDAAELNEQEQFRSLSLYAMFKSSLQEPLQEQLQDEIKKHPELASFQPVPET